MRTSIGISQAELGRQLGVTQTTISNWESGKTAPSKEQLGLLAKALGSEARAGSSAITQGGGYGEWLETARVQKGLTRNDLAAASGVSAIAIYNIETGRTENPRPSTRDKLEKALGVRAPPAIVKAAAEEADIPSLGQLLDFDPHDENDYPAEPGVYVFYDVSDRPVYVGQSSDIRKRIRSDHSEKFWFRTPIVYKASYVRVDDSTLRQQLESTLIKFLKSNAVINRQLVSRG